MRVPRSFALKQVLSHVRLAQFSKAHPDIEVETIVAFKHADDMGRRAFLTNMTQFTLLTGLFSAPAIGRVINEMAGGKVLGGGIATDKRVAVIGAGLAGLNAAYQLHKSGIKATIYEGSGRVGGRVVTHNPYAMRMDVHPEFGGDFIDSDHADMLALVREFKLELIDIRAEAAAAGLQYETFYFDGRHIPEQEIIQEFEKIVDRLGQDIASMGKDYDTPAALRLDNMTLADYIDSLPCIQWLKEILTAAFVAEFGLDASEQSSINMLSMIGTDTSDGFKVFGTSDERYRIKHGNSQLPSKMASKLKHSIKKDHMLTAIASKDDAYLLSFEGKADVTADFVIIAIPFTMLKDVKIDLVGMTPEKMNAIKELGYGQNNKLFLGFDSKPWREGPVKYAGYLFHTDIQNGWDSTTTEYSKDGKGVYCCYFGGTESIRLSTVAYKDLLTPPNHHWKTNLPKEEVNTYVDQLEQVFPGSKAAYANKHVFACWTSYPYVKAAYTCPKPGQWNGALLHAQESIGDVYFAGEHCSADFQGFMNGAAETGRVAAEQIVAKVAQT